MFVLVHKDPHLYVHPPQVLPTQHLMKTCLITLATNENVSTSILEQWERQTGTFTLCSVTV